MSHWVWTSACSDWTSYMYVCNMKRMSTAIYLIFWISVCKTALKFSECDPIVSESSLSLAFARSQLKCTHIYPTRTHACVYSLMGWHISQVIAILQETCMRCRAIILAHFSVWHCILTTFSTCDLHECKTWGMPRIFRYCFSCEQNWGSVRLQCGHFLDVEINCHSFPDAPAPSWMLTVMQGIPTEMFA